MRKKENEKIYYDSGLPLQNLKFVLKSLKLIPEASGIFP